MRLNKVKQSNFSNKKVFIGGLFFFIFGFGLLIYDVYGLINKSNVLFAYPKGNVSYSLNPVIFWISGVFWLFVSLAITFAGAKIIWLVGTRQLPANNGN